MLWVWSQVHELTYKGGMEQACIGRCVGKCSITVDTWKCRPCCLAGTTLSPKFYLWAAALVCIQILLEKTLPFSVVKQECRCYNLSHVTVQNSKQRVYINVWCFGGRDQQGTVMPQWQQLPLKLLVSLNHSGSNNIETFSQLHQMQILMEGLISCDPRITFESSCQTILSTPCYSCSVMFVTQFER